MLLNTFSEFHNAHVFIHLFHNQNDCIYCDFILLNVTARVIKVKNNRHPWYDGKKTANPNPTPFHRKLILYLNIFVCVIKVKNNNRDNTWYNGRETPVDKILYILSIFEKLCRKSKQLSRANKKREREKEKEKEKERASTPSGDKLQKKGKSLVLICSGMCLNAQSHVDKCGLSCIRNEVGFRQQYAMMSNFRHERSKHLRSIWFFRSTNKEEAS